MPGAGSAPFHLLNCFQQWAVPRRAKPVASPCAATTHLERFRLWFRLRLGQCCCRLGAKALEFFSVDAAQPAKLYFNCAPAHTAYPHRKVTLAEASPETLGSAETSNRRTIHKFLVPSVLPTCQLLMGMTQLEPGSLWNTMPCHMHDRRMEVYFYFDMKADAAVFHMMGEPTQTRHLVVRNEQAVISPSWSLHSGVGTQAYTFIWGMVGENQVFSDMDHIPMTALR